jgi:hypothetical protein
LRGGAGVADGGDCSLDADGPSAHVEVMLRETSVRRLGKSRS